MAVWGAPICSSRVTYSRFGSRIWNWTKNCKPVKRNTIFPSGLPSVFVHNLHLLCWSCVGRLFYCSSWESTMFHIKKTTYEVSTCLIKLKCTFSSWHLMKMFLCSKDVMWRCALLQGCTSNLSLHFVLAQIVRMSVSPINTNQGRGIHRNSPLCGWSCFYMCRCIMGQQQEDSQ